MPKTLVIILVVLAFAGIGVFALLNLRKSGSSGIQTATPAGVVSGPGFEMGKYAEAREAAARELLSPALAAVVVTAQAWGRSEEFFDIRYHFIDSANSSKGFVSWYSFYKGVWELSENYVEESPYYKGSVRSWEVSFEDALKRSLQALSISESDLTGFQIGVLAEGGTTGGTVIVTGGLAWSLSLQLEAGPEENKEAVIDASTGGVLYVGKWNYE